MDLYCPNCGEPWENDSLHDEASERVASGERGATYESVAREFRTRGCAAMREAFGAKCSEPSEATDPVYGLRRQDAAAALYELLGDDMDGAAAMLEDLRL